MALVCDDGQEWYEACHTQQPYTDWVLKNVTPVLGKKAVPKQIMRDSLSQFLRKFDEALIICDWPEDIKHFCDLVLIGGGLCISMPPKMYFQVVSNLKIVSKVPHNALEDAKALRNAMY